MLISFHALQKWKCYFNNESIKAGAKVWLIYSLNEAIKAIIGKLTPTQKEMFVETCFDKSQRS